MQEKEFTLAQLAKALALPFRGNPEIKVTRIASLESAVAGDLSFLHHPHYAQYLDATKASIVILSEQETEHFNGAALIASDPYQAYAAAACLFDDTSQHTATDIHPTVVIGEGCEIADNVTIGPYAVIGNHVKIGSHVYLGAGCVIGDHVEIGDESYLFAHVTLYSKVFIGQRVRLHSGVVLGSEGFGLNKVEGEWQRIPQLGRVIIHDEVDIGANTTVDRGALGDTILYPGVKLDNQIQIGHNVEIGAHTAVAGCVGIAGSTKLGEHCMVGGGACIAGHLTIANQVVITGMAQVTKSILKPGVYSSGTSLQTNTDWHKSVVRFKQLDIIARRVNRMLKKTFPEEA